MEERRAVLMAGFQSGLNPIVADASLTREQRIDRYTRTAVWWGIGIRYAPDN